MAQRASCPISWTIGKGLGGGYAPIAGFIVHEKVVDVLTKGTACFNHGQTYQAHPVSCAAALAVQKIIKRENLCARGKKMGLLLESELQRMVDEEKFVGNARGKGLLWGLEFVSDKQTRAPFEPSVKFGSRVQKRALELGVAVYPGAATVDGAKGDHIIFAPPYTATEKEITHMVEIARQAYREIAGTI